VTPFNAMAFSLGIKHEADWRFYTIPDSNTIFNINKPCILRWIAKDSLLTYTHTGILQGECISFRSNSPETPELLQRRWRRLH
jgi:hypothetical protein